MQQKTSKTNEKKLQKYEFVKICPFLFEEMLFLGNAVFLKKHGGFLCNSIEWISVEKAQDMLNEATEV